MTPCIGRRISKPRYRYAAILASGVLTLSSGCLTPPKSYSNSELKQKYEQEFASRALDPIDKDQLLGLCELIFHHQHLTTIWGAVIDHVDLD